MITLLTALAAGAIGFYLVFIFISLKDLISSNLAGISTYLPLWSILGAFLVGGIIYKIEPKSAGEGIPSYLKATNQNKGYLKFSETFFKFWAALFTLGTFGIGGIVGPLGRISAGITSSLSNLISKDRFTKIASICGLAAAVGAITNSSIGGGIFAVEIIHKNNMNYRELFPAIIASSTAVYISEFHDYTPFFQFRAKPFFMEPRIAFLIILTAIITGFLSKLYTNLYRYIAKKLHRGEQKHVLVKVLFATFISTLLAFTINPDLVGTSYRLFGALFTEGVEIFELNLGFLPIPIIFLVLIIIKAVTNCLTVGSGMSAGFTGPIALMGLFIGAAISYSFGIEPLSANYFSLLAAGIAGFLAGSMNIPLAASIITVESFGLDYGFASGFSAIIAYNINTQGTIYFYSVRDNLKRMSNVEKL